MPGAVILKLHIQYPYAPYMDAEKKNPLCAGYPSHALERYGTEQEPDVFEREKKTDCGDYREVDIIPRTNHAEKAVKGRRGKKKKVTEPKQRDLNDKNAKRYLVQLGNGNFGAGDLHVTLTYSRDSLPENEEQAEAAVKNYLRRIAYKRMKLGLESLKYILVTEYGCSADGEKITRIHHHIIMNGGLPRDDVELMWTTERINWKKAEQDQAYRSGIKRIGWANADRLQVNENGIEGLCKYITKNPKGKKRWSSSRNLVRPVQHPPADSKYSRRQVETAAKAADGGRAFFEKRFPDYEIRQIRPEYYDQTGWHIYLKMWRKKKGKRKNNGS